MSKVTLLRHDNYCASTTVAAVRTLLEPLGGISAFISEGQSVLLKPNLVMGYPPEKAINTHPTVVRAVALLAREVGALRIGLGDSPGMGSCKAVAEKAGYGPLMRELDIECVEFTPKEYENPDGIYPKLILAKEMEEFDVVINLAKLKTHGQMMLTAAVKNHFGLVPGFRKVEWHYKADTNYALFGRIIHDIARVSKTHLHIVDAITAMDGLGPTAGDPNQTGFLSAGVDPFAIDTVLMQILGKDPSEHPPLAAALELGTLQMKDINVVGETIDSCKPANWNWPVLHTLRMHGDWVDRYFPFIAKWLRRQFTAHPKVGKECKKCGECARICPAKVIVCEPNTIPVIDLYKCIRCYCCHELCPHHAMLLTSVGFLGRMLGIGKKG